MIVLEPVPSLPVKFLSSYFGPGFLYPHLLSSYYKSALSYRRGEAHRFPESTAPPGPPCDPTEACLLSCTSICDPVNWLEKHKEWQRDCIMDTAPQVSPLPRSRQKARVQGAWPWKVTPYLWIALSDSQHRNCCLFLYLGWRKNCSLSIRYPHVEPAQSQTSLFTFQMALTVLRPDSPAFLKCVLQWR